MKKFLLGKRIFLRGLTEQDIQPTSPYYQWLDDLSLDLYTERSYFPNTPKRMESYFKHSQLHQDLILLGIFDNESEKHIGNITFSDVNYFHRRAFIAYLLGDISFAGKAIMTEATLIMMYYGFNKLNFKRIDGGVSDIHPASRRVCEKVGLLVEGTRRKHFLRNGVWHDSLIVGALREEWMESHGEKARECFEQLPT